MAGQIVRFDDSIPVNDAIAWKYIQETEFEILSEAVKHIRDGKEKVAKEMLTDLMNHLKLDKNSENLQYFIFASALLKRFGSDFINGQNNIYLRNCEKPQINLFNLLATHIPLVYTSCSIANEIICRFISSREEVTLMDIGIGTGRQEIELFKLLSQKGAIPEKLNLVGIDPSTNSLHQAEENLFNLARKLEINLYFYSITKLIEDLNDTDWKMLEKLPGDLIINESFAVHHILARENKFDLRDEVFSKLKQLNPLAFILTEPSSNHNIEDIWVRFNNCWKHFGLTFNVIDQINIPEQDKDAIKLHFFGREIENILGSSDEQRCERHETAQMWADRLKKAGFKLNHDFDFLRGRSTDIINVLSKEEYIVLDYKNETIVSILCGV